MEVFGSKFGLVGTLWQKVKTTFKYNWENQKQKMWKHVNLYIKP